jgi:hypothetical protein
VSILEIAVAAGDAGPVVKLSGECDITVAAQLREALQAQITRGAPGSGCSERPCHYSISTFRDAGHQAERAQSRRSGGKSQSANMPSELYPNEAICAGSSTPSA